MIASVIWNNGSAGSLNAATRNLIVFYITTALYKDRQKVLLNFMNNTYFINTESFVVSHCL